MCSRQKLKLQLQYEATKIYIKCKASKTTLVAFLGKDFALKLSTTHKSNSGVHSCRWNLQKKPLRRKAHYDVNSHHTHFMQFRIFQPASWSSGDGFVSGAGGLRFKSRAGQLDTGCQLLATASTFLLKNLCCPGAMMRKWAPPTCYTLRRNTASIMKDLI